MNMPGPIRQKRVHPADFLSRQETRPFFAYKWNSPSGSGCSPLRTRTFLAQQMVRDFLYGTHVGSMAAFVCFHHFAGSRDSIHEAVRTKSHE
jgi:hypothetical protein